MSAYGWLFIQVFSLELWSSGFLLYMGLLIWKFPIPI